jgi:hypothetical protein
MKGRHYFGDLDADGRIILEWSSRKYSVRVWLRRGSIGRSL